MMIFAWSERKSKINLQKHKVSFEEAESVFYDDCARLIEDPEHSKNEERFILLGISKKTRILIVVHCYHETQEKIRIISARKATKNENETYHRYLK